MAATVESVLEPFVRRGVFATPELAAYHIALDFVIRRIKIHEDEIAVLEAKCGMDYLQFEEYLKEHSAALWAKPDRVLNRAVMLEEDDALTWKAAVEMRESWSTIKNEIRLRTE